jgi:hypothetical protein
MLTKTLAISLIATLAAAQCDPSPTSSDSPQPTASGGIAIHPNGNNGKCLDIADDVPQDGSAVHV